MDVRETLSRLGLSLALGLLIGVERHWREREEGEGHRTAGVRTFGLTGLLGGLTACMSAVAGPQPPWAPLILIGICFTGFSAAVILFRLREAAAEGTFSVTSVIAAQATFLLGSLAVLGDLRVAAAAGVAVAAVLASRELLHGFVERISWQELRSAVLLLSMTFVILPLIPAQPVAVLGGLNPAKVWIFAITLAAVSYVGYGATRVLGARHGLLLAGAAGGLASSTAVVISNARDATLETAKASAAGALVAGAVSYARTAVLAVALAPQVGRYLVPALAAGVCGQVAVAGLLARQPPPQPGSVAANPFELWSVLKLALLIAIVGLLAQKARDYFGNAGLYVVSVVSGLADVDVVTLSATGLVPNQLDAQSGALVILLAVASNTLAKAAYGATLGTARFGINFGVGTAIAVIAAVAAQLTAAKLLPG